MQFIINGIIAGSVYSLVALGFSLIYRTARFFHFAHGAVYTAGAFFCYTLYVILNLPFLVSVICAILLTCALGSGMEISIFRPLRKKTASGLILLITSLGLFIVLQNIIALIFGNDTKTIRAGTIREGYDVFGAKITGVQVAIILVSICLFLITAVILKYSRVGKRFRAVAIDQELAIISGIDVQQLLTFTFLIGSGLAAIAAILVSLDTDMNPAMGFNALLYAIIAVIIGGLGNILGVYLGGMFLGLAQHLAVSYIPTQWQDAIAFVILVIFLLFKPEGFFGKKLEKATV